MLVCVPDIHGWPVSNTRGLQLALAIAMESAFHLAIGIRSQAHLH